MLNKERPEVVNAMIHYFGTDSCVSYGGSDMKKDMGYKGEIYSEDFEKWANSEYVKPFKITQAEKGLLELYYGDGMKVIRRFKNGKLAVSKDGLTYVSLNILDNHYNFIHFCESYDIKKILENCEVID